MRKKFLCFLLAAGLIGASLSVSAAEVAETPGTASAEETVLETDSVGEEASSEEIFTMGESSEEEKEDSQTDSEEVPGGTETGTEGIFEEASERGSIETGEEETERETETEREAETETESVTEETPVMEKVTEAETELEIETETELEDETEEEDLQGSSVSKDGFIDVASDRYFYRPVQWAVENGITTGISPIYFGPEDGCTRAQTVTFLWRMAGKPEPNNIQTKFTDVIKGSYYEKAVAWAVENGITTGTSPTTFEPNGLCSRAEFVTFLYRVADSPAIDANNSRFTDLESGRYYEKAVIWAVENGVTTGTSPTAFSPHETCTRGQVVTFLHRWRTTLKVQECGANPDDGIDDTDAFNRAIDRVYAESDYETVYVPAGTYTINAEKGIVLKSNTNLLMEPGTVLKVTGNSLSNYGVISLKNVENVSISGGQIEGERYRHIGSSGEWGMGIDIRDSRNINISKISISANWGDGIYLGTTSFGDDLYGCDNIRIEQCNIYDNRRSNISIVDADNVIINECTISNANGTAPQCGINIEPNRDDSGKIPDDAICKHITISNTTVNVLGKDDYWGQFFCFMTINYPDNSIITARDIRIFSCTFNGDCGNYSGADVTISDTVIRGTFYDEQGTNLNNVSYEGIWRN